MCENCRAQTSTTLSIHLNTSQYISIHLNTSQYISIHLNTTACQYAFCWSLRLILAGSKPGFKVMRPKGSYMLWLLLACPALAAPASPIRTMKHLHPHRPETQMYTFGLGSPFAQQALIWLSLRHQAACPCLQHLASSPAVRCFVP